MNAEHCRNAVEEAAYQRAEEELERKVAELEAQWPVREFSEQAADNLFDHVGHEFLVSLITECPDEVLRLLINATGVKHFGYPILDDASEDQLDDSKVRVMLFITQWMAKESRRLQSLKIEQEMRP